LFLCGTKIELGSHARFETSKKIRGRSLNSKKYRERKLKIPKNYNTSTPPQEYIAKTNTSVYETNCFYLIFINMIYWCPKRTPPSILVTSPFSMGFSMTVWTNWANSSGFPGLLGNGTILDMPAMASGVATLVNIGV